MACAEDYDMAGRLCERVAPAMRFCRLFGLGLPLDDSVAALAADAVLVVVNLSMSTYGYGYVMAFVKHRMPVLWDATNVMSVIKVYTYLLTPPVMMVAWQYHRRALARLVLRLDEIAPAVRHAPLAPFARYAAGWLLLSMAIEWSAYTLFQIATKFQYFTWFEYAMIAVYNVWSTVPLLLYVFLVDTVRRAVRDVNDRITCVAAWTAHRDRWKELGHVAVGLARDEFGVIVVTFVVCAITQIVFFMFSVYFITYKYFDMDPLQGTVYLINILFNFAWMFEIFRVSHNCRLEVHVRVETICHYRKSFSYPCFLIIVIVISPLFRS